MKKTFNMIKVVIIDDEMPARKIISAFCANYTLNEIEIVAECASVDEGIKAINKHQPDLIFLDIQMPGKDGFELLSQYDNIPFEVIFTTAHQEHAIKAIKKSALDYLLKPFSFDDFEIAVHRFEQKSRNKINFDRYKLLMENINNQFSDKQRLAISTKNGFQVIQINSIRYIKSESSGTIIYLLDEEVSTNKSMKELEEALGEPLFLRVQRSYLVNKNYIKKLSSNLNELILSSGDRIPFTDKYFTKKKLMDEINHK